MSDENRKYHFIITRKHLLLDAWFVIHELDCTVDSLEEATKDMNDIKIICGNFITTETNMVIDKEDIFKKHSEGSI